MVVNSLKPALLTTVLTPQIDHPDDYWVELKGTTCNLESHLDSREPMVTMLLVIYNQNRSVPSVHIYMLVIAAPFE